MSKILRILKFAIPILVLLAAAYAGNMAWKFHRSMPQYEGQATMPGLSAQVTVFRDDYGVPHIFAQNMDDAVRALGYVHASERMFQMEMQRRAGQGRLAEAAGSSMLDIDKFTRTLGLYHLAESSFAAMSPQAQKFFQAYADGVNGWLGSHKNNLSPQFSILGITPETWKPADSIVWGKLMGLELSHNYKIEMLRARLASVLSASEMREMFPLPPGDAPVTTSPRVIKKAENALIRTAAASDAYDRLGKITGLGHGASNEWVISGSRTASGTPILANDPHLGLEAPILWYLARIVTPGFSIRGATVPGLPIFLLGQNDDIAWGFTTTGSDVQDLFIETVDPKDKTRYMTPGGSEPFVTRDEIIKVKHGLNVTLHVRATRHGPVLSDIDDDMADLAGDGKVMALAFTGLGAQDRTSEALMRLNRAHDWAGFTDALKIYQTPPQNVVYADKKNIGFFNPGLVPVRKKGDGEQPVDGASGDFDWVGMIPFTQLPQLYDPPAGYIFNANNAVVGFGFPYFLGTDWEEPYRAKRLQQFFNLPTRHSIETSIVMQADYLSLAARELMPYLLNAKPSDARAAEALDMLRKWDGRMNKDRPEPLIFDAWLYEMHQLMLVDKAGDDLKERGPYAATSIAAILSDNALEWCGESLKKPGANCSDIVSEALDDALDLISGRDGSDMKAWQWGKEHRTMLKNKVYSHIPFLSGVSDLSVESSGDFYTLDRGGSFTHDKKYPFSRTHGGGYRGIYDLGDPAKSRFMIATGESGHIFSPHYGDLTPLWNNVQSITLTGTQEGLSARGLPELVLRPQ